MKPTVHVVGFSGGADSQATALLVRRRFPADQVLLLNSDAGGNEHPLTSQFIEDYSRRIFPVTVVRALVRDLGDCGTKADKRVMDLLTGLDKCVPNQSRIRRAEFRPDDLLTFDRLAYIKGRFPSRKAQFCTEYLKLAPSKRWLDENLTANGYPYERWIGVRADESELRARAKCEEQDDYFGCTLHRPILKWSKEQVFAYLKEAGESVNPLYLLGFDRVGCAPCVNSNKQDVRLWAARFPEMITKVRAWEQATGHTFFHQRLCPPYDTPKGVDEVVAWSKTEWGGKQLALPLLEAEVEAGGCMSRWGLCE